MDDGRERVLVVGATGYVGRHLVARLHEEGYLVRAVVRDGRRALERGGFGAPELAGRVDELLEAPDGGASLGADVMADVDHVISALGVTRQKADPWLVDFRLNLHYLELAEQRGVASFVYVGVMHADSGTSAVSRSKHAFMEALARADVGPRVVNPSGFFSDLTEVFEMAQRGMAVGLGDGSVRLSPIHGADLAEFCVSRLGQDPGSWDVGGPEVLTYRQVVETAFDVVGRKGRYVGFPCALTSPAVWLADRAGPRASSLARFFVDGLQIDSVGINTGTRTIREYYESLAHGEHKR